MKGIAGSVETFEVIFDRTDPAGASEADPMGALRDQLARIDPSRLSEAERQSLLAAMTKLVRE